MNLILLLLALYYLLSEKILVRTMKATVKGVEQDETLLEYVDFRGVKVIKYNKTTMGMAGPLIIKRRFINVKINVKTAKKMGNGYIRIPLFELRNQDYCELLNNRKWQKMFLEEMFKGTDVPNNCTAQLPGIYNITNYGIKMPYNMPTGEYRADWEAFVDRKLGIRFKAYVVVGFS